MDQVVKDKEESDATDASVTTFTSSLAAAEKESASSLLSLVAPQTKKKWRRPDTIDAETLKEVINARQVGANTHWTCPLCSTTSMNSSRAVDHFIENHPRADGVLEICQAYVERHGRGARRTATLEKIGHLLPKSSFTGEDQSRKSSLETMLSFNATDCLKEAYAQSIFDGALPIRICEQNWPNHIVEAGIQIGARAVHDKWLAASKNVPKFQDIVLPRACNYKVGRASLTISLDEKAEKAKNELRTLALKEAKAFGATQLSDGRSNIKSDSLLVFGIQAGDVFLPQGAHNAGANKRDGDYLTSRSVEYLEQDQELADYTFSVVGDGTASAQSALTRLEECEYLLPIPCQSHAVSLLIKDIALKGFRSAIEGAEKIISWVRGHPEVNGILKKATGNRSLFRFVPFRFATHVIGCNRLLDLKASLRGFFLDEKYVDYKRSLNENIKQEAEAIELLAGKADFWADVEAFVKVATPVVVALRLMDQSLTRTKHVTDLWCELSSKFNQAVDEVSLSLERRAKILKLFENHRKESHRPIFDAAWVLNPANAGKVRELLLDPTTDGYLAMQQKLSHTRQILATIVRRKALIKVRQCKRSTTEPSKAKKPRLEEENIDAQSSAPSIIRSVEIDETYNALWSDTSRDFNEYIAGQGAFKNVELVDEESWNLTTCVLTTCVLRYFALRILNMAATISDIERLDKVYSQVHSNTRHCLKDDRVDRLTQGRLALKIFRLRQTSAKKELSLAELKGYRKNTLESEDFVAQLNSWSNEITATARKIYRSIENKVDAPGFELEGMAEEGLEKEDEIQGNLVDAATISAIFEVDEDDETAVDKCVE